MKFYKMILYKWWKVCIIHISDEGIISILFIHYVTTCYIHIYVHTHIEYLNETNNPIKIGKLFK